MKKLLLTAVILVSLGASSAWAWTFNHSYIDPKLMANKCTVGSGPVPNGGSVRYDCCTEYPCVKYNSAHQCVKTSESCADGKLVDAHKQGYVYSVLAQAPSVNETCYHPSCYIRAASTLTGGGQIALQPLTNHSSALRRTVNNINTGGTLQYRFRWSSPSFPDGNGVMGYFTQEVDYTGSWTAGTGTSAMQGLLWAWRMLSPKWAGYWKGYGNMEYPGDGLTDQAVQLRTSGALPSATNSKNIIIISDGIDSDGPDYKPGGRTPNAQAAGSTTLPGGGSIPKDDATLGSDSSVSQSIGFHAVDGNNLSGIDLYESCDAHAPIASITKDDYTQVCQKLAAQGIKVYVILYLYGADDITDGRLSNCAAITGGTTITDATPANISSKLSDLLSAIATRNIRLIK